MAPIVCLRFDRIASCCYSPILNERRGDYDDYEMRLLCRNFVVVVDFGSALVRPATALVVISILARGEFEPQGECVQQE